MKFRTVSSEEKKLADEILVRALSAALETDDFRLITVPNARIQFVSFERGMPHELYVAANNHPSFLGFRERYFGEQQLSLKADIDGLIRRASAEGPEAAVAWLHRVFDTEVTDLRMVAEIFGVGLARDLTFTNGVQFVSLQSLPPSQLSADISFIASHSMALPFAPTRIFALVEFPAVPSTPQPAKRTLFSQGLAKIGEVIDGLTLTTIGAPVVGVAWLQFADPNLDAYIGWMAATFGTHDGYRPAFPDYTVDVGDIARVNGVLDLPEECTKKLRVPAKRLNLARRRPNAGDRAIDGCIALEAVFNDAKDALSHKVATRAARYLEDSFDQRLMLRNQTKAFYHLRSTEVHGTKPKPDADDVARDGLMICFRVLRKIVHQRRLPDIDDLDLGT